MKWTAVGNLHVTVLFLGDTDEEKIPAISEKLDQIAAATPNFSIRFDKPIYAPPNKPTTMVWMKFAEIEEFKTLAEKVIDEIGKPEDKQKILPHITLARFREDALVSKLPKLGPTGLEGGELAVGKISLIDSKLTPAGHVYTKLAEYYLK